MEIPVEYTEKGESAIEPAKLHEERRPLVIGRRFPRPLFHGAGLALCTIISASLALAQNAHYTISEITSDSSDHHTPSINNKGEIVWSQFDSATGFWQIFSNSGGRLTSDTHNHYNPVIDDNGDVIYLKDGQGAGPGLAAILFT